MPEDRQGRHVHFTADVWSGKDLSHSFLKGWPLIQPTNRLAHTQLSGDNHLSNLRAPPHPHPLPASHTPQCTGGRSWGEGFRTATVGSHMWQIVGARSLYSPAERLWGGMAAALRQQCFFFPSPSILLFLPLFLSLNIRWRDTGRGRSGSSGHAVSLTVSDHYWWHPVNPSRGGGGIEFSNAPATLAGALLRKKATRQMEIEERH